MESYHDLVERVTDTLGRSDLEHRIPDWVRMTEAELVRDLRLREAEVEASDTWPAAEFINLPRDYMSGLHIEFQTNPLSAPSLVNRQTYTNVKEQQTGTHPLACTIIGTRLYCWPSPEGIDYRLYYRDRLTPLSESNQQNRILADAPDALFYGVLLHSSAYTGDSAQGKDWAGFFARAKDSYRRAEWRHQTGPGPLRVRPDSVPSGATRGT